MNAIEEAYLRMKQEELEERAKCSTKEDASNDKSDDGEGLDKADPKQAKKDFKDRKDKDIDNDGDVDGSDEYLHKKRKAISKEIEKESVEVDAGILEAFAIIAEATAKKEAIEIDDEDGEVTKKDDDKKKKAKKGEEEVVDDNVAEENLDELSTDKLKAYRTKASSDAVDRLVTTDPKSRLKYGKRLTGMGKASKKLAQRGVREEAEELDELSKDTLSKYAVKATAARAASKMQLDKKKKSSDLAHQGKRPTSVPGKKGVTIDKSLQYDRTIRRSQKTLAKRDAGLQKAGERLLKKEEAENLEELKARTVGSYIRKATDNLNKQKSGYDSVKKHNDHSMEYKGKVSPAMKSMQNVYKNQIKKRESGLAKADRALARKESYEANNAKWKDWVDGLKEGAYKEADKKVHSPNAEGKEMLEPRAQGEKDFKDMHNIEVFDRVPKDDQGITANVPSRKLRPGDNDIGDTKTVKVQK